MQQAGKSRADLSADLPWTLGLFAIAVVVRLFYAAALGTPPYDPWRHLLLIEALRAGEPFSLFDGQPYLWYQPIWHPLAALFPRSLGPALPSVLFGSLQAALWFPLVRALFPERSRVTALAAALGVVAFGPIVRHTIQFGPEALALCLVTTGLLLHARRPGMPAAAAGGLLFGIGTLARLNLGPLALLALPLSGDRRRAAVFSAGVAVPLLAGWWRNHSIIARHDWLFSWDGLAVRADGFDLVSTLMPQRHPSIGVALARLHEQIVPVPEWLSHAGGIRWEMIAFLAIGIASVGMVRHVALTATCAVLFGYLLLADSTGSSNFFRLYLPLLPLLLTAYAVAAERLRVRVGVWSFALVALALAFGAPSLRPLSAPPLEFVVPVPGTLEPGRTYAVTSGFYHPEALAYAYPESRFVGLPLDASELSPFLRDHRQIDAIVLHDFTVQPELSREVERLLGPAVRGSTNPGGYGHRVYRLDPAR